MKMSRLVQHGVWGHPELRPRRDCCLPVRPQRRTEPPMRSPRADPRHCPFEVAGGPKGGVLPPNQCASPWLTGRWYLTPTRASRLPSAGTRVSPIGVLLGRHGFVPEAWRVVVQTVADRRAAFLTRAVVIVFAIVAALGHSDPALRSTIEYQYREMLIRLPHHIPTMIAGRGIIADLPIQERYLRGPSCAQLRRHSTSLASSVT